MPKTRLPMDASAGGGGGDGGGDVVVDGSASPKAHSNSVPEVQPTAAAAAAAAAVASSAAAAEAVRDRFESGVSAESLRQQMCFTPGSADDSDVDAVDAAGEVDAELATADQLLGNW